MQQSLFGSMIAVAEPEKPEVLGEISLTDAIFTVIDLETTGLSAKKNAITEVTAIQFKDGVEQAKFSTLVKPTEEIPEIVEQLTGINNDMVQNAPPLITVLTDLCTFVGASPLVVGHNVSFDINFLREKLDQAGLSSFVDRFDYSRAFCTKVLAQKALPGLPSYEGIVVATQCGVHNPNPHRAESDVRMSSGILFSIIQRLKDQGVALSKVQDLLSYQGILNS